MTSAELAEELRIKETYLRSHWKRIVESNNRAGITLVKVGRGANAAYGIKSYGDNNIRWRKRDAE
jgi:hypothetical protein